jgi:hypothetical protein
MNRITLFFAASIAALILVLAGCGSKPQPIESVPRTEPGVVESAPRGDTASESNATVAANPAVIRDWMDRSIGEVANPAWLLTARRGNYTAFKSDFNINPGYECRQGTGNNVNRNAALIQAELNFATKLAMELRTTFFYEAGGSNSGITDGELATAMNAAINAKVTVAGFQRVAEFWQQQEVTGADGRKQNRYVAYIFYACPPDVWDQIVAKYLFDIVGRLPDNKSQQAIAGMFEDFKADSRREDEKSEAQWRAEVEAQKQAAENQHQLAMAQTPGGVVAAQSAGQSAQTKTVEDARTLRAAIRSGNPVAIAAAAVTAADYDAVAALAAAAGL